jgi:ADP-ribose pyrophosphatase YjhB (NUDIX family)
MVKRLLSSVWRALPKQVRRAVVRTIEPHFTVATGAVVLDDAGRVLLLEHVFRTGSGWGLPGGFLAKGEQPEDAIRRELREEIGLEVAELELALVRALTFTNQVEIVYRALAAGEPSPRGVEIRSYGWFERDRLDSTLPRDQRAIVARVLEASRRTLERPAP